MPKRTSLKDAKHIDNASDIETVVSVNDKDGEPMPLLHVVVRGAIKSALLMN